MERQIRPGEFYRHFKNKLYQVVAVAVHSETGEPMVVYQALYGDYRVYVRPYEMFAGEVDREKYPDVKQKYRFERVQPQMCETAAGDGGAAEDGAVYSENAAAGSMKSQAECGIKPRQPSPAFLRFLETESFEIRMECLKTLAQSATQTEIDSICMVLDMKPEGGTVKAQVEAIRRFLTMQNHFDGNRLR